MTRSLEIFFWLWLAAVGALYLAQFKEYAVPVARLVLGLAS